MEQMETPDYVNVRPQAAQNAPQTERRFFYLILLSFGLLCIIQATLNISLRLTLYSGEESTLSNCSTNQSSGQITEFGNTIRNLENELNALKQKLKDLPLSCRQCPANWRRINDICYFLSSEEKTWEESRNYCVGENSDLVVINNEEEQRALTSMEGDSFLFFWIGLSFRTGTGTLKWVDGSAPNITFWLPGQPTDGGRFGREICVKMARDTKQGLNNWFDDFCGSQSRWLCEKDP